MVLGTAASACVAHRHWSHRCLLAASLAGGAQARSTQLLTGRVADVKDGDTIVVEDRVGQFLTVRFNGNRRS